MRSVLQWLVYLSAVGFWTVVGVAAYRVIRAGKGINDKVRTEENVVAVLGKNKGKKTIE